MSPPATTNASIECSGDSGMRTHVGRLFSRIKSEIQVYQRALSHPRTPKLAKWLLGLALVYLISPIDIIPDFIPFAGQLDDLVIIPVIVWLALRLIPKDVLAECRQYVVRQQASVNSIYQHAAVDP